ncbi:MAG: DinB family protein [Melioribacteraceae bacterium]
MKKYFLNLFEYNDWANFQLINKLILIEDEKDDSFRLMSHIISAQETWLERLKGSHNYSIDIWETFTIQELQILSDKSSKECLKFINKFNEESFNKICNYKNLSGKLFTNSFQEILTHVINHSTYHRAQINIRLKLKNIKPANIDYILYEREKLKS